MEQDFFFQTILGSDFSLSVDNEKQASITCPSGTFQHKQHNTTEKKAAWGKPTTQHI
jgi:hypothetical protein